MKMTVGVAKPVEPPKVYTLELSEEEATVLAVLVGNVAGSGKFRETTDKLWADGLKGLFNTKLYDQVQSTVEGYFDFV